jgi:hypothetical protein
MRCEQTGVLSARGGTAFSVLGAVFGGCVVTIILMGVVAVALVAIVVGMIWLLMRIDWDSRQRIERQF